eukprot:c25603_g1_i1 orf=877-2175(-)
MTSHKYPGNYAPIGIDQAGKRCDAEIWRVLSQRKFLCFSCAMLLLPLLFVLLSSLHVSVDDYPEEARQPLAPSQADVTKLIDFSVGGCNIWNGAWIPDTSEPGYTNETCPYIQDHQNCLKNGRPDRGFLHWRWKPKDCDLAVFDARSYLKLVRGKSWAFIGDSISRNHFQSFLCSLAQVENPKNLYRDDMDRFVHWFFPSYNFTLAVLWSPFLVEGTENESEGFAKGIEKLHLDTVDNNWASVLHKYDYVVLSSGQWYLKSSAYFVENKLVGGHYCPGTKEVGFYYAYRLALRTVFNFLLSSDYTGVVFFRTFTPDHFENGRWDNGGNCIRTAPFRVNATSLQGMTAEMYRIQLEEFGKTLLNKSEFTFQLHLADTIHASLLRPDAHPGPYRTFHPFAPDKDAKIQNDCLHWCLPGAIDTWSAMLLEMLRHL